MKSHKRKKTGSPALQNKLSELEDKASERGFQVHYELLEAAGLKLKGGMCRIDGESHIYIDKRKSTAEKVDILSDCLNNPIPQDIPVNE